MVLFFLASFRGPGELGVHTGFQWACKRKGIYQRGAGCIQGRQLVLAFIRRAQKSAKESVQKFFLFFFVQVSDCAGFRLALALLKDIRLMHLSDWEIAG